MMDHDTARDLLAPYALGALDPEERAALEALLADWPEGRAELAALCAVADSLAALPAPEAPALGLESRIIARARADRHTVTGLSRRAATSRRPTPWRYLPHTLAAAFAVLAVGFGVIAFTGNDAEGRWVDIQGTEEGRAYITVFREQPIGLFLRHLDPPPPGQTYQLWLLPADGQQPEPGKTFTVNESGDAGLPLRLPPDTAVAGFALTLEAMGGADTPTLPAFLIPTD